MELGLRGTEAVHVLERCHHCVVRQPYLLTIIYQMVGHSATEDTLGDTEASRPCGPHRARLDLEGRGPVVPAARLRAAATDRTRPSLASAARTWRITGPRFSRSPRPSSTRALYDAFALLVLLPSAPTTMRMEHGHDSAIIPLPMCSDLDRRIHHRRTVTSPTRVRTAALRALAHGSSPPCNSARRSIVESTSPPHSLRAVNPRYEPTV